MNAHIMKPHIVPSRQVDDSLMWRCSDSGFDSPMIHTAIADDPCSAYKVWERMVKETKIRRLRMLQQSRKG